MDAPLDPTAASDAEWREIPVSGMDPREMVLLLKAVLVPRPIAWVGTLAADGTPNLAPHSFYSMSSNVPPILHFTSNGWKDTVANVEATGEFTVSLVSGRHFEQANRTSAPLAPEVDEFDDAGLRPRAGVVVSAPAVADSPAVIECRLHRIDPFGDSFVVHGDVVHVSVREDTLTTDERGRTLPDVRALDPLARLGRNEWSTIGEVLTIERPQS